MRELKFRVWTGSGMEYRVMVGHLGAFYVEGLDERDSACLSWFNTIYDKSTPVMQFTGLRDKNGKEIYEGDIIEWDGDTDQPQRMIMTWSKDWQGYLPFINSTSEVIGNIYEKASGKEIEE